MPQNYLKPLSIGHIAKVSGLTLRTIRWYTELGLLSPVGKTNKGHALYSEDTLKTLHQIKMLKQAGAPLGQIKTILDAARENKAGTKELALFLRKNLETRRQEIFNKQQSFQMILRSLDYILNKTRKCVDCSQPEGGIGCWECENLELLKTLGVEP